VLGAVCTTPSPITVAVELAGVLMVELELGDRRTEGHATIAYAPGRRRQAQRRIACRRGEQRERRAQIAELGPRGDAGISSTTLWSITPPAHCESSTELYEPAQMAI